MAVRFFGERWDAPMLDDGIPVDTPVDQECIYPCGEPIVHGDQGVFIPGVVSGPVGEPIPKLLAAHRECFVLAGVGPLGHLEGRCPCKRSGQLGGHEAELREDELPWREQGRAVIAWLAARR
jgi:hypothetical protein